MSSLSLESPSASFKSRKMSPLLSVSEGFRRNVGGGKTQPGNVHLLEHRVDQLNQQIDHLQSEKEQQYQENQILHGRLSALIDVVPAGVIILDEKGQVSECNACAEELLGRSLAGQLWRVLLKECFNRREDDGHEISTVTGRRLSISTRSLGEQKLGQIILLSDQTETRQLQAQVSQQQRLSALGQMVSALAHQIRTPLSAALLYAAHLCDQSLDSTQQQQFSQKLRSRLQHLERQVRDMLLFVKGELPLNDQITVQQLKQELSEALEMPVAQAGVMLDLTVNDRAGLIRCNKDALINAVINLANNAIQAYEEAGISSKRLLVDVTAHGGLLTIVVRDFGPGISQDLMAKLDQPFVTTKAQGTGLGLAVVRAVANAHQGNFHLQSVTPGVAARIELPFNA